MCKHCNYIIYRSIKTLRIMCFRLNIKHNLANKYKKCLKIQKSRSKKYTLLKCWKLAAMTIRITLFSDLREEKTWMNSQVKWMSRLPPHYSKPEWRQVGFKSCSQPKLLMRLISLIQRMLQISPAKYYIPSVYLQHYKTCGKTTNQGIKNEIPSHPPTPFPKLEWKTFEVTCCVLKIQQILSNPEMYYVNSLLKWRNYPFSFTTFSA